MHERGRRRLAVRARDGDVALAGQELERDLELAHDRTAGLARRAERRCVGRDARAGDDDALAAMRARSCPPAARRRRGARARARHGSPRRPVPASLAYTVAPARASSSAAARPLRARPTTLISPRVHAAGSASVSERTGTSANLERAEGEEGADDADDPEPHDDLLLAPSLHLEVMMERRSEEDAVLARVLQP
jgi:hypothetical protein